MSLKSALGAAVAASTKPFTAVSNLNQGGQDYPILAGLHSQRKPGRAGHTGGAYDAVIRIHGPDIQVQPAQNGIITLESGDSFIIWKLLPSPGGSHILAECVAPPGEAITPQEVSGTDDGAGGTTTGTTDLTPFLAKIMSASDEKTLTAGSVDLMARLIMKWPDNTGQATITTDSRVLVRGVGYSVLSVGIDDENPLWKRAVLAKVT